MKKYFCVADCHSFFTEMMEALNKKGFDVNNPDHIFVSIGDLFDRGDESREMLEFVNSIPRERKILIRGNHEVLMNQMMWRGDWPRSNDKKNGTWKTACDLTQVDIAEVMQHMRHNKSWWDYYHDTVWYAVVGDFILTHAWVPCESHWDYNHPAGARINALPMDQWNMVDDEMWEEVYTWYNGMEQWKYGARVEGKTIICGHWNTSWGWMRLRGACMNMYDGDAIHEPFIDDGIVALDACTVVSHKVNCFVFEA